MSVKQIFGGAHSLNLFRGSAISVSGPAWLFHVLSNIIDI